MAQQRNGTGSIFKADLICVGARQAFAKVVYLAENTRHVWP